MKLKPGVFYYDCGDCVYLRSVNDAREYLFNPIGCDILDTIRRSPGCSAEDICTALLKIYEIDDPQSLREDVDDFLRELLDNSLIEDDSDPPQAEPSISDYVEELCQRDGKLFSATLELTYRCNEKCVHCYVDDGCSAAADKELTFEEYRSILDQLKELGCIHILLTGGEVCLRRDFLDIAQYAVSRGFLVDVYTNGIGMTDEQFDRLCEMKVNSVSFSLYSGDADLHDAITKVPGSFERTLKRLMMFKCAGVDTFIKTVVIQQNLEGLESLFRLGKRLGIAVNPATIISDTHTGASKSTYRLQDQSQRLRAARLLQQYDPVHPDGSHRDLDGSVCKAGITTLSIDPWGGVHPCLAFNEAVGSVRTAPIRQIWEQAPLMQRLRTLRFRDLSEHCGACPHADTCGVCIGAAYSESGGCLCPNTDSCPWAEAKHHVVYSAL